MSCLVIAREIGLREVFPGQEVLVGLALLLGLGLQQVEQLRQQRARARASELRQLLGLGKQLGQVLQEPEIVVEILWSSLSFTITQTFVGWDSSFLT